MRTLLDLPILRCPVRQLCVAAAVLAAALGATAQAEDYPAKPVKMVVPYSAGGLPDTIARILGQKLSEGMNQQFVIDNRPGAGGIGACELVAKAAPDGYTLLVGDVGQTSINPFLYSKLPYDPVRDLVPVSLLGLSPLFLVLHPSVPAANFPELVAYVRAHPGKLDYGSSGSGSVHHLAMEALKAALGLDMVHVPFKGTGQSVPALVGGQVALIYSALPSIEPYVKTGKVRVLAVSTPDRAAEAPGVPTISELGVLGYDYPAEIGLLAPAGTPPQIIERLHQAVVQALRAADIVQRFSALGIAPVGSTPEAYARRIASDQAKYAQVVKVSGAKLD
jgi:tripartite-type tricarboxylate transporter receptor subunit TctC